jgi:hypothetical protein
MMRRAKWMVLFLIGASTLAQAEPPTAVTAPDAEFLEFLGSWSTGDNQWMDPFQIDDTALEGLERRTTPRLKEEGYDKNSQQAVPHEQPPTSSSGSAFPRRDVKP